MMYYEKIINEISKFGFDIKTYSVVGSNSNKTPKNSKSDIDHLLIVKGKNNINKLKKLKENIDNLILKFKIQDFHHKVFDEYTFIQASKYDAMRIYEFQQNYEEIFNNFDISQANISIKSFVNSMIIQFTYYLFSPIETNLYNVNIPKKLKDRFNRNCEILQAAGIEIVKQEIINEINLKFKEIFTENPNIFLQNIQKYNSNILIKYYNYFPHEYINKSNIYKVENYKLKDIKWIF